MGVFTIFMLIIGLLNISDITNIHTYLIIQNDQPTLIKYSEELRYYPFAVNLDKCAGRCNTLDDLSSRVCVPNETEDLNLINESRTLTRHISCKCECEFYSKNLKSN